jgi:hypothetical protein
LERIINGSRPLIHSDSACHQDQSEEKFAARECDLGPFGHLCVPSFDINEDWPV